MTDSEKLLFRPEVYGDGKVLFLGPDDVAGYIYSIQELSESFPGEEDSYRTVATALSFLLRQGRLGAERPSAKKLASAFEIVAKGQNDEDGTLVTFADPLDFPGKSRYGCQFSIEQLMEFGKGNVRLGIERVAAYLSAYYRENGTIQGAVSTRRKKGGVKGEVESTFKEVLAWEKEQRAKAREAKKTAREAGEKV